MENDTTRQKIMNATIECISKYGVQAATNRLIAKSANVNIAAINYYFGSKEILINEALKHSLDNYLMEFFKDPDKNQNSEKESVLKRFLSESLKDAISSPHITKSFLYDCIINNNYNGIFIEKLNHFLKELNENTNILTPDNSDINVKYEIIQMVSSILFIGLAPDFFKSFLEIDIKEPVKQNEFIDVLIKRYKNNC